MAQIPIFITVTGQKTNAKVRLNINNITKYRPNDGGGTSFFTNKEDFSPYMIANEEISKVDKLIREATEEILKASKPQPYSLKP